MAKTGKYDDLGPVYMVDEHYNAFKDILKNYTSQHKILEIGSLRGRSAIHMLSCNQNIKITCLDIWENHQIEIFLENIQRYDLKNRINSIKDTSANIKKYFSDSSVDFIYLDASHKYKIVLNDLHLCYDILKPNGLILGDDYHMPDVNKAVNEIIQEKKYKIIWLKKHLYFMKPNKIKIL